MKILQVTNFFKPSWEAGGVTRVCYEISKNLVNRGHEVTVYTTDGYGSRLNLPSNKPLDVDGIKVYYFSNLFRVFVKKMNLTTPYYLPIILRKEIKKYDIIHIHEHRTLLAVLVHYYAKKYSVPYIVQAHGSVLPFFQKSKLKNFFDYLYGYDILKDASRTIALTKNESEQYLQMGIDKSKICIIPNGIDLEKFDNLPNKGKFKQKYSIGDNERIILYLGRIDKIKGIDLLINAFSSLINELDNIRLVIVGPESDYLPVLTKQITDLGINDKILFIGPLYERDKIEAYVDADIYVLPSRYETFPNTVLEACMCGSPVIITDRCGISDIVEDYKLGCVVDFNKDMLRNAMFNFLSKNRTYLSNYSCAQIVKENFNWSNILIQIESLYENTTKKDC